MSIKFAFKKTHRDKFQNKWLTCYILYLLMLELMLIINLFNIKINLQINKNKTKDKDKCQKNLKNIYNYLKEH